MVDDGRGDMKGDGTCGVAREQGVSFYFVSSLGGVCIPMQYNNHGLYFMMSINIEKDILVSLRPCVPASLRLCVSASLRLLRLLSSIEC